ncbi:hypothetical protein [Nocardia spumae]|uniref:hypothetical protein n=1 Tax=Nocardia spumae TaxID=2887190 RepID=UPI001D154DEA|nr:hypothetical protein [Nocardia spumae]
MSEPWFLAPERCAERGARMQLLGHVGCRCQYCTYEFEPSPIPVDNEGIDVGADWDRARDRSIDYENGVL